MLKTKSLTKRFTPDTGIFDVDIEINPGEIVGFLGPNGAGKTTFMSTVLGFTKRDSGSIELFNQETQDIVQFEKFASNIGFLLAEQPFPNYKSSKRILSEIAQWRKRTEIQSTDFYDWRQMADEFNLNLDKKYSQLSLGNKRKVAIISAIMHKPKLIVMDEPTSGLDPILQKSFGHYLKELAQAGSAIILSSHVLSEVENICDRIVMIKHGRITLKENTEELLKKSLKRFRIDLTQLKKELIDKIIHKKFWSSLQEKEIEIKTNEDKSELIIMTRKRKEVLEILLQQQIHQFYLEQPSLEELFLDKYNN